MPVRRNPAWTNRTLDSHWEALKALVGPARLPRVADPIAKPPRAEEYGSGSYGTVMPTHTPGIVCKVTSDPSEAKFVEVARQLGEMPEGIVRYEGIVRVPSVHQRRPVYVLWREEATEVGELSLYTRLDFSYARCRNEYERECYQDFWDGLNVYRGAAAVVRAALKTKRFTGADVLDAQSRHRRFDSTHLADELEVVKSQYRGILRAAAALEICELAAQLLGSSPESDLVGEALEFYQSKGILLADVHHENVGKVARSGYTQWVITDPGHAVLLTDRFKDVEPPMLAEAR